MYEVQADQLVITEKLRVDLVHFMLQEELPKLLAAEKQRVERGLMAGINAAERHARLTEPPKVKWPPLSQNAELHQAQSNMGQVDETVYAHSAINHRAVDESIYSRKSTFCFFSLEMV